MGLSKGPLLGRSFSFVRNATIAVFIQFLSALLTIVGIVDMRKAFDRSGAEVHSSSDIMPWITAGVVFYCLLVVVVDVSALYVVWKDERVCRSCASLSFALHAFLWFCTIFFGLAIITLTLGYVVKGLGANGLISQVEYDVFYGLTGEEIGLLYENIDSYLSGAWMFVFGAFFSIPPQGWLISAVAVELSILQARETVYKPGISGVSYSRRSKQQIPFYSPTSMPTETTEHVRLLDSSAQPYTRMTDAAPSVATGYNAQGRAT